eukprot:CAMPEP_0181365016 /NCGR_PEP_ID=MMETSP1106-20121128/9789_1 /TAXON_ID=81844 /ORGANISM="Mantoniella antarctica, Strain SL-175" /LENGTH=168 /DNA_ID=CAMNT_0023479957 /DNA_START=457 /DNA_END=959 /DNA_ORIENTATION=+
MEGGVRPHATIELPPAVLGAFNDTDADANGGERDDRPPKDEHGEWERPGLKDDSMDSPKLYSPPRRCARPKVTTEVGAGTFREGWVLPPYSSAADCRHARSVRAPRGPPEPNVNAAILTDEKLPSRRRGEGFISLIGVGRSLSDEENPSGLLPCRARGKLPRPPAPDR